MTDRLVGIFYRVYNGTGHGYLESVYEGAMAVELAATDLEVQRQPSIEICYRGVPVGFFRVDFAIEGVIILELRLVDKIRREHEAQLLNYLRASGAPVGLLLNFGPEPSFRRVVYEPDRRNGGASRIIRGNPPDPPNPRS